MGRRSLGRPLGTPEADRPGCPISSGLFARALAADARAFSEPRRQRPPGSFAVANDSINTAVSPNGPKGSCTTIKQPNNVSDSMSVRNPIIIGVAGRQSTRLGGNLPHYHAKWANALLASAMRCTFSRVCMAAPSPLNAAISSVARRLAVLEPFPARIASRIQRIDSES